MEIHQLHQLYSQFIFITICSDKGSSDGFIKAHRKKTEVISEKLFKLSPHGPDLFQKTN